MRVRLLGTGTSNGWPQPWCGCASCRAAAQQGVLRGQTGALVDDRLMLDLGADLPLAAIRQGAALATVDAVLVTHADQFCAEPLQRRQCPPGSPPLVLVGPPAVVAAAAPYAGETVTLREARAGDRLQVAGYDVVALPASGGGSSPALSWDVTGPDGGRLLYAPATGPLPEQALRLAAGRSYDLVLLGLPATPLPGRDTPADLALTGWPVQVERLRAHGAATANTRVVAVQLGHGNPPPDVLDAQLATWGASAGRDGQVLQPGLAVGRRVLVLGGARSGKSAYAEALLAGEAAVTYVATAPPRADDAEWAQRVRAHVARRPTAWRTVETGDAAGVLRAAAGPVLVDDLGLWLTRLLDATNGWNEVGPAVDAAFDELDAAWRSVRGTAVLVAPEVGSGVVPAHRSGRVFRDLLGTLTVRLAAGADEVVQVVAGLPRRLT